MKILLTGANGQLGHDCRKMFTEQEVIPTDVPDLDITDREQVDRFLTQYRPDALVNCAAYTAVDKAESEEAFADSINHIGPAVLAQACVAHGVRLVHVSTDYVFSGDRPIPEAWVETDAPAPRTAYGRTKLAGENAILAADPAAVILRTAWLYGVHGKNFPKTMLQLARKNPENSARVVSDQWGCPTWSWRLAEQIKAVLENPGAVSGVCHSVGLGYTNWFEFAKAVLEESGLPHHFTPCTTEEYPTPARRPANSILDDAKLREAGILKMRPWRDDVCEFVAALRADSACSVFP